MELAGDGIMKRALVLLATAATVIPIAGHQFHKRPPSGLSDVPTVAPLMRVSRSHIRQPLADDRGRQHRPRVTRRPAAHRASPRPATRSGVLSDVTEYCSTGSRNAAGRWPRIGDVAVIDRSIPFGTNVIIAGRSYTVEDWIGSGSRFDIFGGDDAACEQRALNYGRRHLRVVIER